MTQDMARRREAFRTICGSSLQVSPECDRNLIAEGLYMEANAALERLAAVGFAPMTNFKLWFQIEFEGWVISSRTPDGCEIFNMRRASSPPPMRPPGGGGGRRRLRPVRGGAGEVRAVAPGRLIVNRERARLTPAAQIARGLLMEAGFGSPRLLGEMTGAVLTVLNALERDLGFTVVRTPPTPAAARANRRRLRWTSTSALTSSAATRVDAAADRMRASRRRVAGQTPPTGAPARAATSPTASRGVTVNLIGGGRGASLRFAVNGDQLLVEVGNSTDVGTITDTLFVCGRLGRVKAEAVNALISTVAAARDNVRPLHPGRRLYVASWRTTRDM